MSKTVLTSFTGSGSSSFLNRLFAIALKHDASDIHLTGGQSPILRVSGDLMTLPHEPAVPEKAFLAALKSILSPERFEQFEKRYDVDFSYATPTGDRFRVNIFWKRGLPALAARAIPQVIPTMDELEAPEAALDFVKLNQGLVLVTGPTGAGKSTLLASMIDDINQRDVVHIITLEDPIEYVYTPHKSLISQRELETDFPTFADGLRHVFRQDPDIILVGELRDPESIATALTLAETGHLVFSTLHTNNAPESVDRLIDVFPAMQQQQIRMQLSLVLKGIISQTLVPTVDGSLTPIHDVLINTHAVANIIREGKTHLLRNTMFTSSKEKMVDRDRELEMLVQEKRITSEVAQVYARDPKNF